MAKPKRQGGGKGGGGGKPSRPFLAAFLLTGVIVAMIALAWEWYGLDGLTPQLSVSGWPALFALGFVAFLGVAYWRGGRAAFWGVVAAAGVLGLVLAWMTDSLPAPP